MGNRSQSPPPDDGGDPIAAYLSRVERRLSDLPDARRRAEMDEIAAHLAQLAEDLESQGLGPKAARALAAERFGHPAEVARGLRLSFLRGGDLQPGTLPLAVGGALLWALAWSGFCLFLLLSSGYLGLLNHPPARERTMGLLLALWFLGTPLCAGGMAALAVPRYAARGAALAFASLTLVSYLLPFAAGGYTVVYWLTRTVGGVVWTVLAVLAALLVRRLLLRGGPRPVATA